MNERIKKLFVCIHENRVIAFETNLKSFQEALSSIEPETKSYVWLHRQFKKGEIFTVKLSGKDYTIQKLV